MRFMRCKFEGSDLTMSFTAKGSVDMAPVIANQRFCEHGICSLSRRCLSKHVRFISVLCMCRNFPPTGSAKREDR
jgi:hypothetical protein